MKRILLIFILLLLLMPAACGGHQPDLPEDSEKESISPPLPFPAPGEQAATPEEPEEPTEPPTEEEQLQSLLDGMTLEEKVGQLFFVQCPSKNAEEKIAACHLGGVLLFTKDYKDASEQNWLSREAFTAKLEGFRAAAVADTGIPLFIGSDEEGGTVTRASRNPNLFDEKLPSPRALYDAGGLDGLAERTLAFNHALRGYGVNVNLAPVCDVSTDPADFIYARSLGLDAEQTAQAAERIVPAMTEAGVGCALKHFPGYGNNVDTHTGIARDERPRERFDRSDLLPFRCGIAAGAPFVLVSHNIVTCMDDTLPASLSPAVHDVLRDELGFDGVILTDDLSMDAVKAYAEDGSVAELALLAGNDMIVTADFEQQIEKLLSAVANGRVDEQLVDAAVYRVLRTKYELGLLTLGE